MAQPPVPVSAAQQNIKLFMTAVSSSKAANIQQRGTVITAKFQQAYQFWTVPGNIGALYAGDVHTGPQRTKMVTVFLFKIATLCLAFADPITANVPISLARHGEYMTLIGTMYLSVIDAPPAGAALTRAIIPLAQSTLQDMGQLYLAEQDVANELRAGNVVTFSAGVGAAYRQALRRVHSALGFPLPGSITDDVIPSLLNMGGQLERASYFALLIYLAGKPVATLTNAIMVQRPKNLEAKYNQGASWASISGLLKMSEAGARRVGMAWELDGTFRYGFFWPVHGLGHQLNDPVLGAIATMVSLLDMAQLAHVKIIIDFFQAHPWASEMTTVAREINTLALDAAIWAGYPLEEQPFAKLLYRDQFKAFDTKNLHRLIALANDILSVDNPTLSNYQIKGADPAVLNEFNNLRALHQPPIVPLAPIHGQAPVLP